MRRIEEYNKLVDKGWKLISYRHFLIFVWGEQWYWSGRRPNLGPFSRKEALGILRFLEKTNNEVV